MSFVDFSFCGIIAASFEYTCILITYCCSHLRIRWNRFVILFFLLNITLAKYIKINDKTKLRGAVFVIVLLGNFTACNKPDFEIQMHTVNILFGLPFLRFSTLHIGKCSPKEDLFPHFTIEKNHQSSSHWYIFELLRLSQACLIFIWYVMIIVHV